MRKLPTVLRTDEPQKHESRVDDEFDGVRIYPAVLCRLLELRALIIGSRRPPLRQLRFGEQVRFHPFGRELCENDFDGWLDQAGAAVKDIAEQRITVGNAKRTNVIQKV